MAEQASVLNVQNVTICRTEFSLNKIHALIKGYKIL